MKKISKSICVGLLIGIMLFISNRFFSREQEEEFSLSDNNDLIEHIEEEEKINEVEIKEFALKVLNSIINLRMSELYGYVSENRGVYFSNFNTFNFTLDIFLTKEDLLNEEIKQKRVTWWDDAVGENTGTLKAFLTTYYNKEISRLNGILINEICDEMTYMNYDNNGKLYQEYDKGFRHTDLKQIKNSFPNSIILDCFFNPSGNFGAMDWCSVMLILEKEDNDYILVGVATDLIGM